MIVAPPNVDDSTRQIIDCGVAEWALQRVPHHLPIEECQFWVVDNPAPDKVPGAYRLVMHVDRVVWFIPSFDRDWFGNPGEEPLTPEQFEILAALAAPGRW